MIARNKMRPVATGSIGTKVSASKISAVLTWVLLVSKDLGSSAFMLEKNQGLHVRTISRSFDKQNSAFSGVLGYYGSTEYTSLGSSLHETPESSSSPLPTSNNFMTPEEVVMTCMSYLQGKRDQAQPKHEHAGLEICYNFSSDSCRMANGGSLESFLEHANNPVFQSMVGSARWEVLNVGPEIVGTPTRGSMQTVLVHVVPKATGDGSQRNDRRFLWTIMKERRPPRQGHCLVHECIAVENAFAHTL